MKKDLSGRQDIERLVTVFYSKVKADPVIGFIFTEIAMVNWAVHLPVMYNFWEYILFSTGTYQGNPMGAHIQLHQKHPLTPAHFNQWKKLFEETVDELFEGEKAEEAKQRASHIAALMLHKVTQSNIPST